MISKAPFANEVDPPSNQFKLHQASGFRDWRLVVDGMVDHPLSVSVSDIRSMAFRSQITEVVCEEGWSYVAEWTGTPPAGALYRLPVYGENGLVGEHRYGRCTAPANVSDLGDE